MTINPAIGQMIKDDEDTVDFERNNQVIQVLINDSPFYPDPPAPWQINQSGQRLPLQSIAMSHRFTSWLVVMNKSWLDVAGLQASLKYLMHFHWECALNCAVDLSQAVGSRARSAGGAWRQRVRVTTIGHGKGPRTPVLTRPTFNAASTVYRGLRSQMPRS